MATIVRGHTERPRCRLCSHTWAQHQNSDSGCWAQDRPKELCGCPLWLPPEDDLQPVVPAAVPAPRRTVSRPRSVPYTPPLVQRRQRTRGDVHRR